MKNLFYILIIASLLVILNKVFLEPTDSTEWELYTGPRTGTQMRLKIDLFSSEFSLPRFPGDVFVYNPLKNIKGVNVYVADNSTVVDSYKASLRSAIKEEYALAYCYLLLMEEQGVELPVRSYATDFKYDFTEVIYSTTFKPSELPIHKLDETEIERFMSVITKRAQVDLSKVADPTISTIVELTKGKQVRYLWVYKVTNDFLYVIDPCAPQLKQARVDLATKEYKVGTNIYKVHNYYRKSRVSSSSGLG